MPPQLVTTKTNLTHRVRIPTTPPPHPTAVLLHGRYGNEDVMWVFARTLPKNWLLVAPRAPFADGDGFSWYSPLTRMPTCNDFQVGLEELGKFIEEMPAFYQTDPHNLHLMSFSQGAALSVLYAMKYPSQVQSIAALLGFLPQDVDNLIYDLPLENKPVFMAAGIKDKTIPLEFAQYSAKRLLDAGADLTYQEYNTGHKLNAQGFRDLSAWWQERELRMGDVKG